MMLQLPISLFISPLISVDAESEMTRWGGIPTSNMNSRRCPAMRFPEVEVCDLRSIIPHP